MILRSGFLTLAVCLLAACSFKPYRIDVRQGNAITQEMVARLTPGMSREQVRLVMGSPMLVDVFHADRWDYVYQFSSGYKTPERRKLTVFFEGDKLARLDGDVVPASGEMPVLPVTPRMIDITGPAPAAKP
ncbi:outer membrane protein assembly factor BamE [Uliginosibacterium aquaticum]|uniref:Outer membrane protein assembly factor BamE n=1 Tax=Uliginosibacterium aquaticum TaxID=2731212 RepID=A0ABX2IN46_9RHOO|nr:outer membrane protein assembly factor BamE [Uliginosibacterium aquaticum]NSL55545.1 outer membrane protein assembly factor BamE [Uliginosibacterium aquaticum]